ncbi:MAG TPA: metallophosphoesterase [Pseudorhizobium sp.]|nr:metallophosphoesterase [Pseudorhizobium sp.]
MKILHVADLHLRWFDWLVANARRYDLLVIAGDLQDGFSLMPRHRQAKLCTEWLLSMQTPTVVCSGNHDFWPKDERVSVDTAAEGGWLRRLRGHGAIAGTDGDAITVEDVSIAVKGWAQSQRLVDPADIVVTHAPPTGCDSARSNSQDFGDPNLASSWGAIPPLLLLCGHAHQPNSLWSHWPAGTTTTLVLVPGCDLDAPVPAYWEINTETAVARHSSGCEVSFRRIFGDAKCGGRDAVP